LKNRVKSSEIELRFREVRPQGCSSRTPVLQALSFEFKLHKNSGKPRFSGVFLASATVCALLLRMPQSKEIS